MGFMKTLTITEAKKNLGKWLDAATKGQEVGIIFGATVVALQPVEIRRAPPLDVRELNCEYAWREYGVTPAVLDAFNKRVEADYQKAKRDGTLVTIENPTLEKIEKAIADHAAAPKAARRTPKKRAGRRVARAS